MVTVEKLKKYLRIDTEYEDELLEELLTSAKAYLKGAVTKYAENYRRYEEYQTKADLLTVIIASEFYQNRDNTERNFSYAIKSLLSQLQYFDATDTDSSDSTETFENIGSGENVSTDEEVKEMLESIMGGSEGVKVATDAEVNELLDSIFGEWRV